MADLPDAMLEQYGLDPLTHRAQAQFKTALFEVAIQLGCTPGELRHRVSRDELLDILAFLRVRKLHGI